MKFKKFIALLVLVITLSAIFMSGCVKSESTSSADNSDNLKYNKQRLYIELQGSWSKPPLYQGNNFASGGVGTAYNYVFQGLYNWIRTTDKAYPLLATKMPENNGNKTTIHLRKGVKWNDGKPFTSKDIWAYYILNNGNFICRFLKDIETPDDYTVVFVWNDPKPDELVTNSLIEDDNQGTIPYHVYGKYVDKAADILKQGQSAGDVDKRGPFGLDIADNKTLNDALSSNWTDFLKCDPKYPIGTGPFIVTNVTASDMILKKWSGYWEAKNITFNTIDVKQMDITGQYATMKSGKFMRQDGTPQKISLILYLMQIKIYCII